MDFYGTNKERILVSGAVSNRITWTEFVGSVPLGDKTLAKTAQKYFQDEKYFNNKGHKKRSLIKRLVDAILDPNLSIIEAPEMIYDEIRENSDAKALNNCIRKIESLAHEGWHTTDGSSLKMTLNELDIRIDLAPHEFLKNGNELCLLYTYFRQRPRISTDGVRALFALADACLKYQGIERVRMVVLDCYTDQSFENTDFVTGENWIKNKIRKVVKFYNAAFKLRNEDQDNDDNGGLISAQSHVTTKLDPPGWAHIKNDQMVFQLR